MLLLVVERSATGALAPVLERATITRLGEGVDRLRRFAPAAIARTCACLDDYASLVRAAGVDRVAVVATSAMRDAEGGETLRARIGAAFGVGVRVLSGDEEARLTFRGAVSGLAFDERSDVAVFDIGGGSTEVVIGRSTRPAPVLTFAQSFDIGSVRLTERLVSSDPPTAAELGAVRRAALDAFRPVPPLRPGCRAVGVAGTVTTLAAVALGVDPYDAGRVHGSELSGDSLRAVVDRLSRLDLDQRRQVGGIEPKRADVIVAGGLIALALLEHWNDEHGDEHRNEHRGEHWGAPGSSASAIIVSDRGVRWGLAEDLLCQSC